MARFLGILLIAAACAVAGDISGKWHGTWEMSGDGQRRTGTVKFVFRQEGDRLTGNTFSKDGDPVSLRNGRIERDAISFELPDGDLTIRVRLRLDGEKLNGEAVRDRDGKPQVISLICERVQAK